MSKTWFTLVLEAEYAGPVAPPEIEVGGSNREGTFGPIRRPEKDVVEQEFAAEVVLHRERSSEIPAVVELGRRGAITLAEFPVELQLSREVSLELAVVRDPSENLTRLRREDEEILVLL